MLVAGSSLLKKEEWDHFTIWWIKLRFACMHTVQLNGNQSYELEVVLRLNDSKHSTIHLNLNINFVINNQTVGC